MNVLEIDVPIAGLNKFPESFFPELTLAERRFSFMQPLLADAIKHDFECDQFFIPELEETEDDFVWYDELTGPKISKKNSSDTF